MIEKERLLTDLLKSVSRAFYLTLRVLPSGLREPIGLAYLLARAADTIADTRIVAPERRLDLLLKLRSQVEGPSDAETLSQIAQSLADKQEDSDERTLLESLPTAFSLLELLGDEDASRVRSIVVTLTRGMEIDLVTFPSEDSGRIEALADYDALDRYTYYVAGCVGEFWTAITAKHTKSLKGWNVEKMSEIGVRFGKALQLTNVLRDVPSDLRIGRCYLPLEALDRIGAEPTALLDPAQSTKARPALIEGIRLALDHYEAAEGYVLAIPRRSLRLRLAAMWPVLIGLATLEKLGRNDDWLNSNAPSKVSRGWVYRMLIISLLCGYSNTLLGKWMTILHRKVVWSLE